MNRIRRWSIVLVAPVLGATVLLGSAHAGPDAGRRELIALNVRGTSANESTNPTRLVWTVDVYSLTAGERIGTATHEVTPTATPGMLDRTITFRIPDGQIVDRALEAFASEPGRTGWVLTGSLPGGRILPERGTGIYAGRTGRIRQSGWHGDLTAGAPNPLTDDLYVIELDAR